MPRRLCDVLIAAGLLALASPILIAASLTIVLEDGRPILYRSRRVGLGGCEFDMLKLRTMRVAGPVAGPSITAHRDARITAVGSFLRRSKIDELPQLVNVLRGEMTLIGPRPEVPDIVARYRPDQRAVLTVKPGITGPGQLYYTDQEQQMPDDADPVLYYIEHFLDAKLALDLEYIRDRTWRRDSAILADTVRYVISRAGSTSVDRGRRV